MNDRFRFRVWDKWNKRHIYEIERTYDSNNDSGAWSFAEVLEDDNFIVEQCTGLRDKNGRLIYEGDKICFEDANAEGVIVFCKGAFCFKWTSKTFVFHHIAENIAGQIDNHDLVIIGNIHEVGE